MIGRRIMIYQKSDVQENNRDHSYNRRMIVPSIKKITVRNTSIFNTTTNNNNNRSTINTRYSLVKKSSYDNILPSSNHTNNIDLSVRSKTIKKPTHDRFDDSSIIVKSVNPNYRLTYKKPPKPDIISNMSTNINTPTLTNIQPTSNRYTHTNHLSHTPLTSNQHNRFIFNISPSNDSMIHPISNSNNNIEDTNSNNIIDNSNNDEATTNNRSSNNKICRKKNTKIKRYIEYFKHMDDTSTTIIHSLLDKIPKISAKSWVCEYNVDSL